MLFCNRETKSLVTAIGTSGSMWMHAYILQPAGSGTGDVSTAAGAAQPIAEERRQSAASSADEKEKKEKKEKKDKDKDPSRKESKEKKKDPKEDEDPVGKTGSRAQKSWFGK